jgi:hypothetical protein
VRLISLQGPRSVQRYDVLRAKQRPAPLPLTPQEGRPAHIQPKPRGDRVWGRVADFIPPNIHQFPPNADPMAQRTSINRPTVMRWAIPLDDTHTMQIGFNRAPEGREVPEVLGSGRMGAGPTRNDSACSETTMPR